MEKQGPLISIITIVYNGEKHLQQTIDSVTAQTYKNIEYIIVDGGSTDNTLIIIKRNENKISQWISEKDQGISDAFNKGITLCNGDIIGFLNADDWFEPQAIERVAQRSDSGDIIYGEVQFWVNEQPINKTKSNHNKLRAGMTIAHPASFIKRNIYKRFGTFQLVYRVAMDYDLFLRFYHKGVKFHKIKAVLTNMRKEGISDTRWLAGIKEELQIKNEYYNHIGNWYHFFKQYAIFTIKNLLTKFKYYT